MTDYRALTVAAARRHGIDPALFSRLVQAESGFNPSARSPAGALGLTQLMPGTARGLGVRNPLDPVQNLDGGARYLAQQLKAFGGDPRKALAAYNAGPGAVSKYGGVPPYKETQAYVAKILAGMGAAGNATAAVPSLPGAAPSPMLPSAEAFDPRAVIRQAVLSGGVSGLTSRLPALLGAAKRQAMAMPQNVPQAAQVAGDGAIQAAQGVAGAFTIGGGPRDHGARALGNWQSDQAYDFMGKAGQPVVLPFGAKVLKVSGRPGGNPQFAGYGVTVQVPGGNLFLKHLGSLGESVRVGAQLPAGVPIGLLDPSTRGGPHLHAGADDPGLLERLAAIYGRR